MEHNIFGKSFSFQRRDRDKKRKAREASAASASKESSRSPMPSEHDRLLAKLEEGRPPDVQGGGSRAR